MVGAVKVPDTRDKAEGPRCPWQGTRRPGLSSCSQVISQPAVCLRVNHPPQKISNIAGVFAG